MALVSLPMLTGCHIYQKFDVEKQQSELAREYAAARDAEPDQNMGNLPWEQVFTDPLLADYIRQALAANTDLENARLNVEVAHANMRGARLSYLPSLTLAPQGGASSVSNGKLTNWNYTIPLAASWEVDVFGKILNNKRSAEAGYRQSQDYCQAVRSQIIGAVANCYYAIGALRSQIALSESTAEIWRQNVETMRDFKLIGRTNEAAVMQSEANYYNVLAQLTDLRTSYVEANNTMALLLHTNPQIFEIPELKDYAAPQIALNGEISMTMLAQRPDVRAAEESLAVAYYATNSARAAFYPSVAITGTYGFTNSFGSFIKNPGDWIASLTGSLTAPLFARGQNIARLQATKAQQKQALNNFENAILSASAEVSNALTHFQNNSEKAGVLAKQVADLEKAQEYTKDLFAAGSATYLEILTAQSSLLSAQMSQINCNLAQAQAVINLYQSLGGGR